MGTIIGAVILAVGIVAGARCIKLGFKMINKVFDRLEKMI